MGQINLPPMVITGGTPGVLLVPEVTVVGDAANSGTGRPTYADFYAPRYYIEADGELAEDIARDITTFSYTDNEKGSDELKITVANPGEKYVDDPRFAKGVRFRVRWGYPNEMSETRVCVITRAKPSFPESGVPTIQMEAYDLRQDMHRGAKPMNWGRTSSSDVAIIIANRYKLDFDIEDSDDARKESRIQPAAMTDQQYLMKLADALNWDYYVEGTVLHFHPKRFDAPPKFTFTYFTSSTGTLMSFSPEVKMGKPGSTGKAGVNTKDGKTTKTEAKPGDKGESGDSPNAAQGRFVIGTKDGQGKGYVSASQKAYGTKGPTISIAAIAQKIGLAAPEQARGQGPRAPEQGPCVSPTPEKDEKVIGKQARARQNRIDMKAVEASIKVVGTPRLRARQNIKIFGTGKTYDGVWRVKSSTHTFNASGTIYVVTCKLTRNALNKGKKVDKTKARTCGEADGKPAEGTTPPRRVVFNRRTGGATGSS